VPTAFVETTQTRHLARVGGLTALERRLRELAKQGVTHAIVAAPPVELARPLPLEVEFVAAGTPPPPGVRVERADVIAGIELVDAAAVRRAEWAVIRTMNKSYEGPVDALINWRFSMRITRALSHRSLAVTPAPVLVSPRRWALVAILALQTTLPAPVYRAALAALNRVSFDLPPGRPFSTIVSSDRGP